MKTGNLRTLGGVTFRDASNQLTSVRTETFGPYNTNLIPQPDTPANIDTWIQWIINRLQAITGTDNWYTNPSITLSTINTTISAIDDALLASNNLGDLDDIALARFNLGLGTAVLFNEEHFSINGHTHEAPNISISPTSTFNATDLQSMLEEIDQYLHNMIIDGGTF